MCCEISALKTSLKHLRKTDSIDEQIQKGCYTGDNLVLISFESASSISGFCPEPQCLPSTKLVPASHKIMNSVTPEEEPPRVNVTENGQLCRDVPVSRKMPKSPVSI